MPKQDRDHHPVAFIDALQHYECARFHDAATILGALISSGQGGHEAALLRARITLKTEPGRALEQLTCDLRSARGHLVRAEAAMLRGVAFARLGDPKSAHVQFRVASSLLGSDERLGAELIYQVAAAHWIERKLDDANRTLAKLRPPLDIKLEVQVRVLRGALASAVENLAGQGAILLDTLRFMRDSGPMSVDHRAFVVSQIASLALELPSTELRDAALRELPAVEWTDDIAGLHFDALRSIAWRFALDGDDFNAFRFLKDALRVASTPAWRVNALAERAYLASALGESRWAAQELRDAHELASSLDWRSIDGEEKFVLPLLAELYAPHDPAVAIGYATTFANLGKRYPRTLSSHRDRRVEALEAFALGWVQATLGERHEAERLLVHAWTIYDSLGIAWRAARAALALADLTMEVLWFERARAPLRAYPRSWLARQHVTAQPPVQSSTPAQIESLTPSQRAVFDLLLAGRTTMDIARSLSRSPFTVRNHIKEIFKKFNVSSRPELIVKSARLGTTS